MAEKKVFGIGWAKTGTTTLGTALNILGFHHKSQDFNLLDDLMLGKYKNIIASVDEHDSFDDWPWIVLYKQLDALYPGSKFILTLRESSDWIKSYRNMLKNEGEATAYSNKIRSYLYNLDFPNVSDEALIARYEEHNSCVRNYFKYREDDLLIVDWSKEEGWSSLCTFLDKPVPEIAFPHKNKGIYR